MSVTALCAVLSIGMISASANNSSDTNETYTVGGYSYTWTDTARLKTDYTSSYQKCIYSDVTYSSWVYASSYANPQNLTQLVTFPKDPSTGTYTPMYSFSTGTTRYMVNYVRENNFSRAGMMFFTGSSARGRTHILWSPDSV